VALGARAAPIRGVQAASVCLFIHSPQSYTNLLTISFRWRIGYVPPAHGEIAAPLAP
jgi:hypothetical protein